MLAPTITAVFNMPMQDGLFPPCLENAHVTPRLKKPSVDHNTLKDYRPVPNHFFMSKVIQKVMNTRLQEHLVANGLHQPMQSAYRPGHSSETALVRVTNDLLSALDRKQVIILVLFSRHVCSLRHRRPWGTAKSTRNRLWSTWHSPAVDKIVPDR